jgi:hypothetical protein
MKFEKNRSPLNIGLSFVAIMMVLSLIFGQWVLIPLWILMFLCAGACAVFLIVQPSCRRGGLMTDHQALIGLIDIVWWLVTGVALVLCIPGIVALWFALGGPKIK